MSRLRGCRQPCVHVRLHQCGTAVLLCSSSTTVAVIQGYRLQVPPQTIVRPNTGVKVLQSMHVSADVRRSEAKLQYSDVRINLDAQESTSTRQICHDLLQLRSLAENVDRDTILSHIGVCGLSVGRWRRRRGEVLPITLVGCQSILITGQRAAAEPNGRGSSLCHFSVLNQRACFIACCWSRSRIVKRIGSEGVRHGGVVCLQQNQYRLHRTWA